MTTSLSLRSSAVRAVSLFVAFGALGFAACSSDDNAAPSQPPTFGNAGSAGSGTGGTAGAAAGTGGTSAGASGSTAGGAAGTEAGGAAGSTAGGSAGSATGGSAGSTAGGSGGCSTTPTTTTEFLNRCSDNSCTPFDNKTRIPGFTGTLPPLP